jgi:alkanesulfonate monooxygenase SsuD/methylene tetrahydromethanopterin reductase-like flavin-dependent oxidoreductase (luciferase family)
MIGASKPRMLRLAAQYADFYNVGYMSSPRSTTAPLRAINKACEEVRRAPANLPYTFMISLAYPDLLGWKQPKKRGSLSGSVEEIASALAEYEALGAAHLMFHVNPSTPTAYAKLAESMQLYRKSRAAANPKA